MKVLNLMPKHPFYESAVHHFLLAARRIADTQRVIRPDYYPLWQEFINNLIFKEITHNIIEISWKSSKSSGIYKLSIEPVIYYFRGDTHKAREEQYQKGMPFHEDEILKKNNAYFETEVTNLAKKARVPIYGKHRSNHAILKTADEEELSNRWALSVNPDEIDIFKTNTACTSPELRYIHTLLGDIKGKTILDAGCGLGEVSVYFATKGARVTALDLSQPMLNVVKALSKRHKTHVKTLHASIEELSRIKKNSFDIVYVGNLFHHVDIHKALHSVTRVLKKDGILVCWEPVHYNPVINVYRKIARNVRSDDERPLTLEDINIFRSYFQSISLKWYWLTTLIIFLIMALIQRRDPNKERYWKAIIAEENKWRPLYMPLEKLDRIIFRILPPLQFLCWNVVIVGKNKKF